MDFTFKTAAKIIFKRGAINELGENVKQYGRKFLIVTDNIFRKNNVLDIVEKQLDEQKIKYVYYTDVCGEPQVEDVDKAAQLAREEKCDAVLSIGGGSLIDVGKAAAALITNEGSVKDYLEYVGKGAKVVNDPVPFIVVPTTAGTGSEVTNNAVIASKKENFKRSMRDEKMMAKLVIIDPMLTIGLPKKITATSGMDAFTHNMEAYVTIRRPSPLTRSIALQGIELAGKYLKRAYDVPDDIEAREGMSLAALCGGMSFSNSGLGAAHGLGMVLNIYYPVSHGEAVAIMLPHVMKINAMHFPGIYDKVGEVLTGKSYSEKGDGTKAAIEFIEELNAHLGIPKDLKHLNITEDMARKMGSECFGTSMSGNPVQLEANEWTELINQLR